MTAIQLNFTLTTSPHCRSVHLSGSWDTYASPLALKPDSSRSGSWKGTYRFVGPSLRPGGRYWYYYTLDGVHATHDPGRPSILEPTTGRTLNVLDIPSAKHSSSSSKHHHHRSSKTIKGRALSPSRINHPAPSRPYATAAFQSGHFYGSEMESLSRAYAAQSLSEPSSDDDVPSFGRRSGSSSPSSVSSLGSSPITPTGSSPVQGGYYGGVGFGGEAAYGKGVGLGISGVCTCERYAVMRDGSRVRVDCGGRVCGASSASESSEEDSEDERRRRRHRSSKRGSKSHGSRSHRSSKGVMGLFGRR